MLAPIFSIDWYRCTYAHRAATYDFWMASVYANIRQLHSNQLMAEHWEQGLAEWLETWRMAS